MPWAPAPRVAHPEAVNQRMAETTEGDVLTIVYTSGTTGPPKGAMLTVSNVEYCIKVLVEGGGFASPPPIPIDLMLSYLPLCHVAERVFTTWFNASAGIQVHFAESIETVQHNLREVQPTILFGVPRIWEKVLAGVGSGSTSATWSSACPAGSGCGSPDRHRRRHWCETGGRHTFRSDPGCVMASVGSSSTGRSGTGIGMRRVRYAASAPPRSHPKCCAFHGYRRGDVRGLGMTENTAINPANQPGPGEARHGGRAACRASICA